MARLALGLLVLLGACSNGSGPSQAAAPTSAAPASAPAAPARAAAAYYHAQLRGPDAPCVHAQPCRVVVELIADGDYHVNQEYPFRFVPDATPGVSFAAARELQHEGEKRGTLEVELTPAAAGPTTIAGTFKLSVCSEGACQIERPRLGVTIRVD